MNACVAFGYSLTSAGTPAFASPADTRAAAPLRPRSFPP